MDCPCTIKDLDNLLILLGTSPTPLENKEDRINNLKGTKLALFLFIRQQGRGVTRAEIIRSLGLTNSPSIRKKLDELVKDNYLLVDTTRKPYIYVEDK